MNDATTALLTEHFTYTPLSLIDDIINSINNLIYQAISSLEDGLLATPPERLGFSHTLTDPTSIPDTDEDGNIEYPEARLEIENGLHQLETLLEANVDKAFDKLEIYVLRNILTVPEDLLGWIRLGHYENLSFGPRNPNAPTLDSITHQRKKLRETRKLQRALKQESARNEAIIAQLRSLLSPTTDASTDGPKPSVDAPGEQTAAASTTTTSPPPPQHQQRLPDLSFLLTDPTAKHLSVGSNAAGPAHTPLTTHTTFILSQLPALRSLLTQLRAKLAKLPSSVEAMDLDEKRLERREYIDGRTRLHLERSGEIGGGNGVGGEGERGEAGGVVRGRKVGGEEVSALEGVVRMLG
ncbi:hypothetical protein AJ80_09572 [Polytolypa hystricis UAMH7299]|uniref:Mis12 domain-containing protein n=1 Tax=Polytolypa hystricis (strain UAMH7299) TaxID=1447883 RepID=A0A2B7WNH2_POLH7|nr:hypothetical protein AJ80_09572 [Polytolypa hystricis UAMH7299]